MAKKLKVSKGKAAKYVKVKTKYLELIDKERASIFSVKSRFKARRTNTFFIRKPMDKTALTLAHATWREQMRQDKMLHEFFGCKHEFQPRYAFEYIAGTKSMRGSAFDADTANEFKAA